MSANDRWRVIGGAMPCWLGFVVACGSPGTTSQDASIQDGSPDAAACRPPMIPDAAPAGSAPSCTAGGIPGSCLDVSVCSGSRVPTAGLCDRAANIAYCTPRLADPDACSPHLTPQPNACLTDD